MNEKIEQALAGAASELNAELGLEINMVCVLCQSRGKTWEGSDPVCAFGKDSKEYNWNCATISLIRDICYEGEALKQGVDYQYCDDQKYATIKVNDIDGLDGALALWVTWYKNRGSTDKLLLLFSNKEPRKPTELECLKIAKHYFDKT